METYNTMGKCMKASKLCPSPRKRASLGRSGTASRAGRTLIQSSSSKVASSTVNRVAPTCNIKVLVRVRPPNSKEQSENYQSAVKVLDDQMLVFDPQDDDQPFFYHGVKQKHRDPLKKRKKDLTFTFDRVFNCDATNDDVFVSSTQSLIDTLMDGCNCSVFAYGATGAGKTFTMIGDQESPGITYLTMRELFKRKDELGSEREFELMATYIEVYNELVKDLLKPGQPLNVREDAKWGVHIAGVKVHKIEHPDDLFELMKQGNKRRTQHPTDANAESSRSHAVLQVFIQMTMKTTREVRGAKLSMIDLAGSERGCVTGYVGARFKEGANINKSLLALVNCINSLAEGLQHVPYRNSKLTRLLKDSLGGNCHTIMIANVSPSSMSFEDTYNTLKYANQAKKIKSIVKRNVVKVDMHVDQYIKLLENLQAENSKLKTEIADVKSENNTLKTQQQKPPGELVPSVPQINVDPIEIDAPTREAFNESISTLKQLLESEFQLQSSEWGMSWRRQIKLEIQSRVSDFYLSSPVKEETRKKLLGQAERYEKKEESTRDALDKNRAEQGRINQELGQMIEKYPELQQEYQRVCAEMDHLKHKCEIDLLQRKIDLLLDTNRDHTNLIKSLADFSVPLFHAVGGRDSAPKVLTKKFEDLVSAFDGKKGLKWNDAENEIPLDSGITSTTNVQETETRTAPKRKIVEPDNEPPSLFESTFVASGNSSAKSTTTTSSNNIMSKAGLKATSTAAPSKRRCSPTFKVNPSLALKKKQNGATLPRTPTFRSDATTKGILKKGQKLQTDRPRWF